MYRNHRQPVWNGNGQEWDSLRFPIQLDYHILQLAKLRMLQLRYDCLEKYCDVNDFEYLEMDTNFAYMSFVGNT